MIADFSGDFLNAENAKDGDFVVIVGDSEQGKIEKDGKEKQVMNIPVEVNTKKKTYTPSRESGKRFIKAWGEETKNWIGKKFQVKHVGYKSFGETRITIEAHPIDEKA